LLVHTPAGRRQGKDTIKFLEKLVVADIKSIANGSGSLSVFTNEKGGCIDDTVITKVQKLTPVLPVLRSLVVTTV
jgi:glycine cleavage system aminomethyltransferase T